jgi:tight adherence protein C
VARARAARGHAERAARAAPQVQLVVALLLVPSVLLLVAAALVPS